MAADLEAAVDRGDGSAFFVDRAMEGDDRRFRVRGTVAFKFKDTFVRDRRELDLDPVFLASRESVVLEEIVESVHCNNAASSTVNGGRFQDPGVGLHGDCGRIWWGCYNFPISILRLFDEFNAVLQRDVDADIAHAALAGCRRDAVIERIIGGLFGRRDRVVPAEEAAGFFVGCVRDAEAGALDQLGNHILRFRIIAFGHIREDGEPQRIAPGPVFLYSLFVEHAAEAADDRLECSAVA